MTPTIQFEPTLTTPDAVAPSLAGASALDRYRQRDGARRPIGSLPPETFPASAQSARAEAVALEGFGVSLPCQRPIRVARRHVSGGEDEVLVRCGTRRQRLCPSCAALYAGDSKRILREGLSMLAATGDRLVFVTATAPSFGRVHHVPNPPPHRLGAGQRKRWAVAARRRCGCGQVHSQADEALRGVPIDPETYEYGAQTTWNRAFGRLWSRSMDDLSRRVGARVAYAAVVEHSARGAVHAHALLRLPASFDLAVYRDTVRGERSAAVEAVFAGAGTTEDGLRHAWGPQVMADILSDDSAMRRTAGYVAKLLGYVSKDLSSDATGRAWSEGRSAHQAALDSVAEDLPCSDACATASEVSGRTCGGRAHRDRGFRGYAMRRSRSWSVVTLTRLRQERRIHAGGAPMIGPSPYRYAFVGVEWRGDWVAWRARAARLLDHAEAVEDAAVASLFGGRPAP